MNIIDYNKKHISGRRRLLDVQELGDGWPVAVAGGGGGDG